MDKRQAKREAFVYLNARYPDSEPQESKKARIDLGNKAINIMCTPPPSVDKVEDSVLESTKVDKESVKASLNKEIKATTDTIQRELKAALVGADSRDAIIDSYFSKLRYLLEEDVKDMLTE